MNARNNIAISHWSPIVRLQWLVQGSLLVSGECIEINLTTDMNYFKATFQSTVFFVSCLLYVKWISKINRQIKGNIPRRKLVMKGAFYSELIEKTRYRNISLSFCYFRKTFLWNRTHSSTILSDNLSTGVAVAQITESLWQNLRT